MTESINIFTVTGKLNKWDIIKSEFTLGTPVGDIKINIEKCNDQMLDEMVDAMKCRRTVEIKVVEERLTPTRVRSVAVRTLLNTVSTSADSSI